MAANCKSCENLRETAPNFVLNGITSIEDANLRMDYGLSKDDKRGDCTDLNDIADCLVNNLSAEIEGYDVCDWKDYTKRLVPNLYQTFKALISSVCGLWCWVHNMNQGFNKPIEAYEMKPDGTYDLDKPINGFRKVRGVEVRADDTQSKMLTIRAYGSTARIYGTLRFSGNMPSDYATTTTRWIDFNSGKTVTNRAGRKSVDGNTPNGNYLIYEYKIDKCAFGFDRLLSAHLFSYNSGDMTFKVTAYNGDGTHRDSNGVEQPGEVYPFDYGYDENGGGQVFAESGKLLIQVRLVNCRSWGTGRNDDEGTGYVYPSGITGVRQCPTSFEC